MKSPVVLGPSVELTGGTKIYGEIAGTGNYGERSAGNDNVPKILPSLDGSRIAATTDRGYRAGDTNPRGGRPGTIL